MVLLCRLEFLLVLIFKLIISFELKERNEIDYFEIRGKTLVVYWMNVKSEFDMIMDLPMIGSIPGTYHAAASYVYEYYDKKNCMWIDGMELVVKVSV